MSAPRKTATGDVLTTAGASPKDQTMPQELSRNERIKEASRYLRGTLAEGLAEEITGGIVEDDQQLVKFHGMYLQDDRDLRGERRRKKMEPAFAFMVRVRIRPQQSIGLAAFALAVTFAPAIGPTIGGYLTENYGWQTIFFVNTAPSAAMVLALAFTLEREPMKLSLLKDGDWAGIITMAIGLSALQTVLEEGNKDDWFASPFILRLAVVAAVFLSAFVAIELTVRKPLVNLRLLKRRNFGIGVLANTLMGFALFGTVFILPQYLGQVQRYNAEQIGNVLAWTGLPQLLLIPLVPLLMKRFDARYIG